MTEELQEIPDTLDQLLSKFIQFLPSLIAALVVFVIGAVLTILITRGVRRGLEQRKVKAPAAKVITRLTNITLWVLTLVLALQMVGFDLTAFLAGLGILGFTIGFALQDVSKNFIAGLLLLVQEPFAVGETIEVDKFIGTVTEIDFRATRMNTLDGRVVLIPNADVFTNAIINYTQAEKRRIEIELGVGTESDLSQVRKVALNAITAVPGYLSDPEPRVSFHTFGDFSINCTLYYWIDSHQTNPLDAKDAGLEAVNTAFLRYGIDMPVPIQRVQVETFG